MQKAILLFFPAFCAFASSAQEKMDWTVSRNKTILLNARNEDKQKNVVHLNPQTLKPDDQWMLSFSQNRGGVDPEQWNRVFGIFDENDKELLRKEGVTLLELPGQMINKWLAEKKKFFIYTWSIPKDPALAAQIRIRRVHLCTFSVE